MNARPHRDQPERDRIRTDLATNMLVEAGAGSGKTTSLVERMLEHVRVGTPVDRIAAVTFTRKAANELRERFQLGLEKAVARAGARARGDASAGAGSDAGAEQARYERALRELDRAFLGTIHSFCARLLRERPLEVGLDPSFSEVRDEEWDELRESFWRRWVERARRSGDADVAALPRVGIDPRQLAAGFKLVMLYPDVDFPLADSAAPDVTDCRRQLEKLLAEARRAMPREEPSAGWDALMALVRRLEFTRNIVSWGDLAQFCSIVESISAAACKVTQNRWGDDKETKAAAKARGEAWTALREGPIAELLRCWREHRYPIVMRVLQRAAADFARERHATGQLGFEDLLLLAAKLLREHPAVRDELGARWAHLLVDEFQDTDPVQAEVCFLLASDASEGSDWRRVRPRPGSLFVVGDPKQSIYRFRRADIQVYELVKRRMAECGAVLALTSNFRSVSSIEAVVNGHFAHVFPEAASDEQAPYRPMETVLDPDGSDGVYRYTVRVEGRSNDALVELDAALVASWIAKRVADGERKPGDFLILVPKKDPIEQYARELAARNVPVTTTGARLPQEHELRELLVVLAAIADPENAVAVVAALEGLFFGLTPADLFDASRGAGGVRFAITHRPANESHVVGRALLQLHEWWKVSQRHAADVLVERMLADTGLLYHAAGLPLGDARAGALLHIVEALRASSDADGGVSSAMTRLELLLGAEAPDASLRPGRTDAVRVMNLHKAKGLEAEVVILAAPVDDKIWDADAHVSRTDASQPTGALCISCGSGNAKLVLAHPPRWAEAEARERVFAEAERARLLYVAATRAKRELVVAQGETALQKGPKPDASMWRPLAETLDEHSLPLALGATEPPGRKRVERSASSLASEVAGASARMDAAKRTSFRLHTVTELAKRRDDAPAPDGVMPPRGGTGAAWGSAVHRGIEALGRGRRGESLRAFAEAVACDEGLADDQAAKLVLVLERLAASEAWASLAAGGAPMVELSVMRLLPGDGEATIVEGVVDAVAHDAGGWRIVDWKTDRVDDSEWASRRVQYEKQVATYATMLGALTGEPATATIERVQ